ncbi:low molecular weight protein-tyrosine-phosphatase [Paenirhodobacter sp.]|uniref:low molecular weight protein-tyrosine-phosphatase n=1 Tax=Paenirhodobacter sp. TaxID=1965326 RepID=UPI003B3CDB38
MRILFLCLGNICRSPAAEGVFRDMAAKAGLSVELDSAGTGGWHVGAAPYGPMQVAARRRGYDLSKLRARRLEPGDFDRFDRILAMDSRNIAEAERIAPQGGRAQLGLFLEGGTGLRDVPDPYYTRDYERCLDIIEAGARVWIDRLQRAQ